MGMQFKNPELLWALFLLLIPIFIHLFQLRRFKKTPFTNVKLLQKVMAKSRKSNNLKKWLLLATRLLLFTALIFAFAQPFFANKNALKEKETVIYLDDSFSMQAKTADGSLLKNAIQGLLQSIPEDKTFTLFTNTSEFRNVTLKEVQNDLLAIDPSPKQLSINEITLKANNLFSKKNNLVKNLVLVSDFQESMLSFAEDSISTSPKHLVHLRPESTNNITIDSVYINTTETENIELTAMLSSNFEIEAIPVSLYNDDKLIAKTSAAFEKGMGFVSFTIPSNEIVKGRIEITDTGLNYDNYLYFNLTNKNRPKVLAVGEASTNYLEKIYAKDEFDFTSYNLENLNYQNIESQNFIILNELQVLPNSLVSSLSSFVTGGGNLLIIPSNNTDIQTYNQLFSQLSLGRFVQPIDSELNINQISFSHRLYKNVFEKNVNNFQYPKIKKYFKTKTQLPHILSYQNNDPFLYGNDKVFVFTASISAPNSNFKQSPLIVPTLYKMGVNSLKPSTIYHSLQGNLEVDVLRKLTKDRILKVSKDTYEFIPQQQSHANKVTLTFNDTPVSDGIYSISENGEFLKSISFNYPRKESNLNYLDMNTLQSSSKQNSISSLFQDLRIDNSVTELWKWFIILAILFILTEVLIIKYLK